MLKNKSFTFDFRYAPILSGKKETPLSTLSNLHNKTKGGIPMESKIKEKASVETFLEKITNDFQSFVDETNKAWIKLNNEQRIMSVRGKIFKSWLRIKLQEFLKKIPASSMIPNIIDQIEANAITYGEKKVLQPRICKVGDKIWYSIGGGINKAVQIDSQGWRVVETGLPFFREMSNSRSQELPTDVDADAKLLLEFINISDEEHKLLFLVTVITCFIPGIEHPSMVFHGSKGAAKTTAMETMKRVVDPSIEKPASLPRNNFDFGLQASQNYLLAYDNLTTITPWQSDLLCQVVTGGSVTKRENYTDEDLVRVNFQGCVAINGINQVVTRPDLLDRSVVFMLERISSENRRSKQEIEHEFSEALPKIMGGIFSTVSKAMKIYETFTLNNLPRMADYFKWGCCIAVALGYTEEDFVKAYNNNIQINQETAIENNLLAKSICILIEHETEWSGLVSDLHKKLKDILWAENYRTDVTFPSAPNKLLAKINEVRSDLEGVGICIEEKRNNSGKKVIITKR